MSAGFCLLSARFHLTAYDQVIHPDSGFIVNDMRNWMNGFNGFAGWDGSAPPTAQNASHSSLWAARAAAPLVRLLNLAAMIPDDEIHPLLFPDLPAEDGEQNADQREKNADHNEPDIILHSFLLHNFSRQRSPLLKGGQPPLSLGGLTIQRESLYI